MKILFAGDSWASKGYTNNNYNKLPYEFLPTDTRLPDFWDIEYEICLGIGQGNLYTLNKIVEMKLPADMPIVWVYSEPGRDYGLITGNPELEWIQKENYFEIRPELDKITLNRIRNTLTNPITLIGGLSDVDTELANQVGIDVLHPSWQSWIATTLNSQWFKFGWGASDVGWRLHHNGIVPSRALTFAWDDLIKEWCWWEENGYFCHEHPTPQAHQEFAKSLEANLIKWLMHYDK
jgi:hypothetical protein